MSLDCSNRREQGFCGALFEVPVPVHELRAGDSVVGPYALVLKGFLIHSQLSYLLSHRKIVVEIVEPNVKIKQHFTIVAFQSGFWSFPTESVGMHFVKLKICAPIDLGMVTHIPHKAREVIHMIEL